MPAPLEESERLLHGPYHAPVVAIGQRVTCAVKGEVIVVGYADAPLRWPICRRVGKGATGLLVAGDLLRALRRESRPAVAAAWGVSEKSVTGWRVALGCAGHNEASRRLQRLAPRGHSFSPTLQPSKDRRRAVARSLASRRDKGILWSAEQDAVVGTDTDRAVAAQLGRSVVAVRDRRRKLGRPPMLDRASLAEASRHGAATKFGTRYAVDWPSVLRGCAFAGLTLNTLSIGLGVSRKTLVQRWPCGQRLWKQHWITAAERLFGTEKIEIFPGFSRPFAHASAISRKVTHAP